MRVFPCVLGAVVLAATAFVVAQPNAADDAMIDFSARRYYAPETVKRAFAAEGVRLRVGARFNGFVTLTNTPRRLTADTLQVNVAPRNGRGSWGARLEPYDERFGNLLVTYGGDDERLLARVEAAVDTLR